MGVNVLHLNFAKGSPDKNNQLLSVGKVYKSYKYFWFFKLISKHFFKFFVFGFLLLPAIIIIIIIH